MLSIRSLLTLLTFLTTIQISAQLNGTYTIGGSSPSYTTIAQAVSVLNSNGVSGPVVFNIRSGVYKDQLFLDKITGASATNTIIFRKDPAVSTRPVIEQRNSSSTNLWQFGKKLNHVVLEELRFQVLTSGTASLSMVVLDSIKGIKINNCEFIGKFYSRSASQYQVVVSARVTESFEFTNNKIENGGTGLHLWQYTRDTISPCIISGNTFSKFSLYAINGYKTEGMEIDSNYIQNATGKSGSGKIGINLSNIDGKAKITRNRIFDDKGLNIGIKVDRCKGNKRENIFIANNSITSYREGINLFSSDSVEVYYNSVRASTAYGQYGIYCDNSKGIKMLNNVLSSNRTYFSSFYERYSTFTLRDYNNYQNMHSGTLESYKRFSNDSNSTNQNPRISSTIDLEIGNMDLNDNGISIQGITQDINGRVRNVLTPDIGCTEFSRLNSDASITEINNGSLTMCNGQTLIPITVKNEGANTLTQVSIGWNYVLGSSVNRPNQTFTVNIASGKDSVLYLLLASAAIFKSNYYFQAYTFFPNGVRDPLTSNDTLTHHSQVRLSGTYTVGTPTSDYLNLSRAVQDLQSYGVCGPVILNIDNAYRDSVATRIFTSYNGSRDEVIIQANPSGTGIPIFQYKNLTTQNTHISILEVSSNITLRNLEVRVSKGSHYYTSALKLLDGATADSCLVFGSDSTFSYTDAAVILENGGLLKNSKIQYGNGVELKGQSKLNYCINNEVFDYRQDGIHTRDGYSVIQGNTIGESLRGGSGIVITKDSNQVSQNIIRNPNSNGRGIVGYSLNGSKIFNNLVKVGGLCVSVSNSSNTSIDHNTLLQYSTPSNTYLYHALSLNLRLADSLVFVRNNQIYTKDNSAALYLNVDTSISIAAFDGNNFYSLFGNHAQVEKNGIKRNYNSASQLIANIGFGKNLLMEEPSILDFDNLVMESAIFDNKGISLTHVTEDINGVTRSLTKPDIGAFEYQPLSENIEVLEVMHSDYCGGSATIHAKIRNVGSATVTSFQLKWNVSINSNSPVNQATYTYSGSLATGEDTLIYLGTYQEARGDTHRIEVYSSLPNGIQDQQKIRDTNRIDFTTRRMSGVYTIGGANSDFLRISEAYSRIRNRGLCSDVIFNIRSGTYKDSIRMTRHWGQFDYHITFQSDPANTTRPIIYHDNVPSPRYSAIWEIEEVENVTISGLRIESKIEAVLGSCLNISRGQGITRNIKIENCVFADKSTLTSKCKGIELTGVDSITINDNEFSNLSQGIGVSYSSSINILSNKLDAIGSIGIDLLNIDSTNVFDNTITSAGINANTTGISMRNIGNSVVIDKNRIEMIAYKGTSPSESGISVVGNTNVSVACILSNNSVNVQGHGITVGGGNGIVIDHNTVNTTRLYPLWVYSRHTGDGEYKIRNNIFRGGESYSSVEIRSNGNSNYISEMNYNVVYSEANKAFNYTDGATTTNGDINDWRTETGFGINSIEEDPHFALSGDLIPESKDIDNKGKVITGITSDIDGKTRSTFTPDIGAFEFTGLRSYVGILEIKTTKEIKVVIYPNPSSGLAKISLPDNGDIKSLKMMISDIQGKVVYTGQIEFENGLSEIPELQSGVYFIDLEGALVHSKQKYIVR